MNEMPPSPPAPPLPAQLIARDMLIRCRDQFQFYGDQHSAKSPPQLEKAAVNYKFVAEINAVLLDIAPPHFTIGTAEVVRSPDANPETPAHG